MKKTFAILLLTLAISGCTPNPDGSSFWQPVYFDPHTVRGGDR
jgi:hypothetical protein